MPRGLKLFLHRLQLLILHLLISVMSGRKPILLSGPGSALQLCRTMAGLGARRVLVVTDAVLVKIGLIAPLVEALEAAGVACAIYDGVEPDPTHAQIETGIALGREHGCDAVFAVGGGSPMDAAKVIAACLGNSCRVADLVGNFKVKKAPLPVYAVPTTAGTGSEATKNAVLSVQGADGFKKSFRDEKLVAEVALVDPDLLASCPPPVIAANGMDALTQLLESYVSSRAAPLTDSLAWGGMKAARDGLLALYADAGDVAARERMAYAALVSGITLAQVGLGSVHGLAAPLGAFFPIPHGVACGTLVATATRMNIETLKVRVPEHPALEKYAQVGRLLSKQGQLDRDAAHAALIDTLEAWTRELDLPALARYGVTQADIPRIVANSRGSSMKTNPVRLEDSEIAAILVARL